MERTVFGASPFGFFGDRTKDRRAQRRALRGGGPARRLKALVRVHEPRASVRRRRGARRGIHRLGRSAFRQQPAPEHSAEQDAQERMERRRHGRKRRWPSRGDVHRRFVRAGDVLDDLPRRPFARSARRIPRPADRGGVCDELIGGVSTCGQCGFDVAHRLPLHLVRRTVNRGR